MSENIDRCKLLIIVDALSMGGAEHMIYELVKEIDTNKYAPEILCYGIKENNALELDTEKVCNVRYLEQKGHIGLRMLFNVFREINKIKPDVVHAHLGGVTFAVPWCFFHKVPLCITIHSKPEQAFSKKNNALIKLFRNLIRVKIIAVSAENWKLVKNFYKITDNKGGYINNGVNIKRGPKTEKEVFTFINVARQDENKNQKAIIDAFATIIKSGKRAKLILVGDGPCNMELRQQVKELSVENDVIFTGMVADPSEYYLQSDVYVQASFREAMPLSVLEAMASRLPIVSTDVGGLKDVVKANGVLIKAGDNKALYETMLCFMKMNEEQYAKMADISYEIVQEYSSERMARKYEEIYDELIRI